MGKLVCPCFCISTGKLARARATRNGIHPVAPALAVQRREAYDERRLTEG